MQKLYKVEAKIVSYFWADEIVDDFDKLANDAIAGELCHVDPEVETTYEVNKNTFIEDHWLEGVPYGVSSDERTLREIIRSKDTMSVDTDYDPDLMEEYTEDSYEFEGESVDPAEVWKDEL